MFESIKKLIFRITFLLIAASLFALILGMRIVVYFSQELPDYKELLEYDPPVISRIYSSDAEVMAEYALERRVYVEYKEIPQLVIDAFLAAEDKNFFHHQGIDIYSILRAAAQSAFNITTNKRAIGGSTITQQVVKSFLLSNERSIERKIKEAILAYRITRVYSKETVLELYLNRIFLGNNSYGISAASQSYFAKDLKDLSIEEAALLAALPKAPSSLNPYVNYTKAKNRRDWVIERMLEIGAISPLEAVEASNSEIELNKTRDIFLNQAASFYTDIVKKEVVELLGEEVLMTRGLVINTHYNDSLQKIANGAFNRGALEYDKRHGFSGPIAKFDSISDWISKLKKIPRPIGAKDFKTAVVLNFESGLVKIGFEDGTRGVIHLDDLKWARKKLKDGKLGPQIKLPTEVLEVGDVILVNRKSNSNYTLQQIPEIEGAMVVMEPNTGRVFSVVGGYDFDRSYFNRAVQAKRQPGSLFKLFVYLAALIDGVQPNSIWKDEPIVVSQGKNMPVWAPKNYGDKYLGDITFRTGLERSKNMTTIRVMLSVGVEKILALGKKLGIYEDSRANYAVALGASETTLLNITNAYNILASKGMKTKPRFIESIYDKNGNLLYKDYNLRCENCFIDKNINLNSDIIPELRYTTTQLVDPQSTYQITSMMNGVVERGTAVRAKRLKRTIAGKTGTTNNSHDTWFIGFTPYITAGVYFGYDAPKDMGKTETGSSTALPVFIYFAEEALKSIPDMPFSVPPGIHLNRVHLQNGKIWSEGESKIGTILEAFKDTVGPQELFIDNAENEFDYDLKGILDQLELEEE